MVDSGNASASSVAVLPTGDSTSATTAATSTSSLHQPDPSSSKGSSTQGAPPSTDGTTPTIDPSNPTHNSEEQSTRHNLATRSGTLVAPLSAVGFATAQTWPVDRQMQMHASPTATTTATVPTARSQSSHISGVEPRIFPGAITSTVARRDSLRKGKEKGREREK